MPQLRQVTAEEYADPGPHSMAVAVERVARACDLIDGVETLNEQARLELKHQGLDRSRLWVALAESGSSNPHVVGFVLQQHGTLNLAVDPDHRRQGVATQLALAALDGQINTDLDAWSHGDHPGAAKLAERFGLRRVRELLVMSRPATSSTPDVATPSGVEIRTFTSADLPGLLEVNARAFAQHPEQGQMSAEDFAQRAEESWFDPRGIFLAFEPGDDHPLGFHWTKIHPGSDPVCGEVYVVAVDPRAAGRGLGTLLTKVGLDHLAQAGAEDVILYVEGDNEPAIAVYRKMGFAVSRRESQYRWQPHP